MDSQLSVPVEAITQAVIEQRNAALDSAAQLRAAVVHLQAENEQLRTEVEKLRRDQDAIS